jgi:hypothetical protein
MNLMKNQIIQQCQILKLKERVTRQRTLFFNHLTKKMWNGFIMFSFRCKSHVQEIILPKTCLVIHRNSFWDFLNFLLQTKIFVHNYVWIWKLTAITWVILN